MALFRHGFLNLVFLVCLVGSGAFGNLAETLAWFEEQLAQGKRIAVLLVDMQPAFLGDLSPVTRYQEITRDEGRVLDAMADREGILLIDVNMSCCNPTIGELLSKAKKQHLYKLLYKETASAFEKSHFVDDVKGATAIDKSLEQYLREENVSDLFVMGCFDLACVSKTVEAGLEKGFSVTVDRDMNVILDERNGASDTFPVETRLQIYDRSWALKMEKYPKLKVIPHKRYGSCDSTAK